MEIRYTKTFLKSFKKRIPPDSVLEEKYKERLARFLINRRDPVLKDHKLIGKFKDFRAFSITGDIRVVYSEEAEDIILFVDIGTHNQVYGK